VLVAEIADGSTADFAAGTTDAGAYVARTGSGEVMLAPTEAAEFTGDELPAGWTVTPYHEGGSGFLGDGRITLDGARVGCDTVFRGPPRAVDFSATFAARPDQHAGFGIDYTEVPWVMFSTKWGRRLYARTHLIGIEDKKLAGAWLGGAHHFRIEWNVLDINFLVDGERAAYLLVPVPGYMRAVAANQRLGGPPLQVEWMRVSPYATAGTFRSRVLDAGGAVDWLDATWQADVPAAATLRLSVRTGDGARPDRTWSPWRRLAAAGAPVDATSRYLQYRARMTTSDERATPVLRRVAFRHRPALPAP
jgi:hypothetical protein